MNLLNSTSTIFVTLALSVSVLLLPTTEASLGKPLATIEKKQLQLSQNNDNMTKRKLQELFGESPSDFSTLFLLSDECSSFMEILGQPLEDLFEFDDETLIAYTCNYIQIREIVRVEAKVESNVANHEQ